MHPTWTWHDAVVHDTYIYMVYIRVHIMCIRHINMDVRRYSCTRVCVHIYMHTFMCVNIYNIRIYIHTYDVQET